MTSDDPNHRRNNSTPQSYPLQDLSPESHGRLRALSDRGRDWVRTRTSPSGPSYSPILEQDTTPSRRLPLGPRLVVPDSSDEFRSTDLSPTSPIDGSRLQEAFTGLSFGDPFGPELSASSHTRNRSISRPSLHTIPDTDSNIDPDEAENYFPSVTNDTAPLTTHPEPIAGSSNPATPSNHRHGPRNRRQSVRFTPSTSPSARLGDELSRAEEGSHSRSRSGSMRTSLSIHRSLSPNTAGTTLQRAGTIVRNMSQRVVNISNQQDVLEQTLRRKSSSKAGREDLPQIALNGVLPVDGPNDGVPVEKVASLEERDVSPSPPPASQLSIAPRNMPNPLKGNSLGMFSPNNRIRLLLCDILTNPLTEPIILALITVQVVLLIIDSSQNVYTDPRSMYWGGSVDWGLLALFSIYTVEIISRSIVSGFLFNAYEYSTLNRRSSVKTAIVQRFRGILGESRPDGNAATVLSDPTTGRNIQPSLVRALTANVMAEHRGDHRYQVRCELARRAYLRHSFNRLDFIAVVSYWISFVLAISNIDNQNKIYVFRMLSCLRILKLLLITNGTAVILRSLKKAAPLLVNVAILIGFFWLIFAILGLQSFKSSLRRQCTWFDPTNAANNWTGQQFCGGWLDGNGNPQPWLLPDGLTFGAAQAKGFWCPVNSKCIQGTNPYNGTVSFDNIFQSLELVFVVMTSNTFSDLLYDLTFTDYLAAAIFFAFGIVILFFWLVSLLIAVITSSFQIIREEGKVSAFTGEEAQDNFEEKADDLHAPRRIPFLQRVYDKTFWLWIAVITFDLIVQALRSDTMSQWREHFINNTETTVTFILLFEIWIRFIVNWRQFFRSKRNVADLFLAIVTSIIQIPVIRNSGIPYAWLTLFQILRIYRLVLAVPITRDLIQLVTKNITALGNQILFTFMLAFLGAILAAQMFRGTLPQVDANGNQIRTTFQTIFNSFLGMYQILSSENWTDVMYHVTAYTIEFNTAWMGAAFFIIWFILANFVVLNMFIAVIQENFDISEDEKRLKQVQAFLEMKDGGSSTGNLSLSSVFRFGLISGRQRDPLAHRNAATEMLLKDAVVNDFLDQQEELTEIRTPDHEDEQPMLRSAPTVVVGSGTLGSWWGSFSNIFRRGEPNPFYSQLQFSRAYEDLNPRTMAKEVMSARQRRKQAQRDYLQRHPNYNTSLFIFKPGNPIRKACQKIVGPGRGGDRIDGVQPSPPIWYAFSAFIYAAIVAMVVLACVTTPLYQKNYFSRQAFSVKNWFVFSDMGFALLFTVEAAIKVIADGFFFTPNAYFRGSWGFIDGIVLLTLWINIATALFNEGQVSRAVGAFKALRALRLLNVSDSARNNFHAVIVRGGWKVLSAAFVSLSLLVPFAIYGLNLFSGKMVSCNDSNSPITNLEDCVDEYMSSPYNWNVWAPRQASNSYFDFDDFGSSLFILFQIVSQEGWIDVMWRAQSITGVFQQQQPFASQGNAIFFVVFNLLGAVFVLTLFVSVFMRNYTEQTGVAFLTADQRAWLELRKLLRQISPSKRPEKQRKRRTVKGWCYRLAVRKTGPWQRLVTVMLVVHVIVLCVDWYPTVPIWDRIVDGLFLMLQLVFISNIAIRIIGLSWTRFRRSTWDIYSLITVLGASITTILNLAAPQAWILDRINRLFLVSIAFLLIPRNNQLDQLFKTAAASLPLISNLMATWFVMFLVYAIALTQAFGLTRFSTNENSNVNFRTVPKALILLFRMSVGEGWNQIMEDMASVRPPYCVLSKEGQSFDSDCGSAEWARALLISWNILSMYIFVNLFVSLIYESFSYVYQRSSGLSVISREEIRRFKEAWSVFDPQGEGFITKEQFPRLLGELSGVFEMRIYDGDFSVKRIIEDCSHVKRVSHLPIEGEEPQREIMLDKLNQRLAQLPLDEIRKRRARMNKFYEEVLVSADPDRGISFTSLLMILAHYKVINDNKSLRLGEFLRRRARLQRVDETVRRNLVRGFFDMVFWTRRFRRHLASKEMAIMRGPMNLDVPAIFIDDEDAGDGAAEDPNNPFASGSVSPAIMTPRSSEDGDRGREDIYREGYSTPSPRQPRPLDTRVHHLRREDSVDSIQLTPTASPVRTNRGIGLDFSFSAEGPTTAGASGISRHRARRPTGSDTSNHWHLADAISRPGSPGLTPHSTNDGSRTRAGSSVSARDVLDVLDNSAWGESIRRSFTQKRFDEDTEYRSPNLRWGKD